MRLHHVAIQVTSFERSLAFWRDLLGLKEVRRQDHSIWLDLDGAILMLELCAGTGVVQPWRCSDEGLRLIALHIDVSQRETWRTRLLDAGIELFAESPYTLYIRDPDGARVGLSHYPVPVSGVSAP